MAYGTVKVDNITFDNGGSDQNVTVSGLYRATTSGVTLSGTIAATTVSGVTVIGSTTVSGATVTGTTANFTSGNFSNIISSAATMSGALIIANQQQVRFREAVGNGVNHIALQAPAIVSADQTITLPDQTGTVVTTGDNGSVTSTMILDGTILNVDINASAGIVDTKLATIATAGKVSNSATTATNANTASAIVARDASGNFTAGTITAALTGAASSNVLKAGDTMTGVLAVTAGTAALPGLAIASDLNTGIYSPGADQVAVSTGGTGRLFVASDGKVGIGTSSPGAGLQVANGGVDTAHFGEGTAGAGINIKTRLASLPTTGTTANIAWLDSGSGFAAGSLLLGSRPGVGNLVFSATGASDMIIVPATGRVGIGTSVPGAPIEVAAASSAGASTVARLRHDNGADQHYLDIAVNADTDTVKLSSSGSANGSIILGTAAVDTLTATSTGSVGIGTSTPRGLLSISNNAAGTGVVDSSLHFGYSLADYYGFRIVNSNEPATQAAGLLKFQRGTVSNWIDSVVINNSGNVGIGTSAPAARLDVTGPANSLQARFGNVAGRGLEISTAIAAGTDDAAAILNVKGATSGTLIFQTDSNERMRIDASGRLLVGTSSARGNFKIAATIYDAAQQLESGSQGFQSLVGGLSGASGPYLMLAHQRSGAIGGNTVLVNGDEMGTVSFHGADGTNLVIGAAIKGEVDGTPGANDMPGRLVFSTTADGAASPTERMRIASNGLFTMGGLYVFTTAGAANVNVDSSGVVQRSTSSIKYKTDIETLENSYSEALLECRPVWYKSTCKLDNPDWGWWGFIAEEVAQIDPRLVHWKTTEFSQDDQGATVSVPCDPEPEGVAYDRFVPHLLNLIKQQKEQAAAMQARIETLEAAVAALQSA